MFFSTAVSIWDADFYVKVDDDVHVNLGISLFDIVAEKKKKTWYRHLPTGMPLEHLFFFCVSFSCWGGVYKLIGAYTLFLLTTSSYHLISTNITSAYNFSM